jgi:hypothetical protein
VSALDISHSFYNTVMELATTVHHRRTRTERLLRLDTIIDLRFSF